jgi:hypothetical protein
MPVLSKDAKENDDDSSYNERVDGPNLPFWSIEELFKEMQFTNSKFKVNQSWHLLHLDTEERSTDMLYKRAMQIAKARYLKVEMQ